MGDSSFGSASDMRESFVNLFYPGASTAHSKSKQIIVTGGGGGGAHASVKNQKSHSLLR